MTNEGVPKTGWLRQVLGHRKIVELCGIDLRALAALRITLAVIVLLDLAHRAPDIPTLYGGEGVLPLEAVEATSLHTLNGSVVFVAMLFVLHGLCAVMMLVGYHTWLGNALTWFLLVSLHMRNMSVNNSGDHLLTLLLFWGLFLPLGARASLDSRLARPRTPVARTVVGVATVALMLQILYPYVFSAIAKSYEVWVTEGLAIYNALSLDVYTKPAGRLLLRWPRLVEAMSPVTYWFELFGPFLAFVPFLTPWFRGITALLFIGFHVSLQFSFELSVFAWVCMAMWLVFLPPSFWDKLAEWRPAAEFARCLGALFDRVARRLEATVREQPWLAPPADDARLTAPGHVLAGVVGAYLLAWNVGNSWEPAQMPKALRWPGEQLYIGQKWEMFGRPLIEDGWWIMPAQLEDGTEVDLFTEAPVHWDKPESVIESFPDRHWHRYLEGTWLNEDLRPRLAHFADWLRRRWDSRHAPERQVKAMEIYYALELTRPDYKPPARSDQLIYSWSGGGQERIVTRRESVVALSRDLARDPELVSDVQRALGADASQPLTDPSSHSH